MFKVVPDETLADIASWLSTTKDLVRFSQTCRRIKNVVGDDPAFRSRIIEDRSMYTSLRSWEQMAFYESMRESGLLDENRIGFCFASTDIDEDSEGDLEDNMERIAAVNEIVREFPRAHVIVDAHCGTLAPEQIAPRFSRLRGMVVVDAITREGPLLANDRLTVNAWGRQVAVTARSSNHPYGDLARSGVGWVEIHLKLNELEFPERPNFYRGHQAQDETDDVSFFLSDS